MDVDTSLFPSLTPSVSACVDSFVNSEGQNHIKSRFKSIVEDDFVPNVLYLGGKGLAIELKSTI